MSENRLRVANAPSDRPLMIYDGDCGFCKMWIERWRRLTEGGLAFAPSQEVADRFPEIPAESFDSSVQLVDCDGTVYEGAEAVLRGLGTGKGGTWLLNAYLRSPVFAGSSEFVYSFVARNRTVFSFITKFLWGKSVQPSTFRISSWVVVRLLGVTALIAFASLWVQGQALFGSQGILPVDSFMERYADQLEKQNNSPSRFLSLPTLFWYFHGDTAIHGIAATGSIASLMLIIGICPALAAGVIWITYLSLMIAGQTFLTFQWDILLLECSFLAIFFAPWVLFDRPSRHRSPAPLARLLVWWVLFRLMFESGLVKINHWSVNDVNTWRDLTAMNFHYWSQPLPSGISWFFHQMPSWFHETSLIVMMGVELILPFLIFAPRRPRLVAILGLIALQAIIIVSGNYGFFNLLSILLCISAIDDQSIPSRLKGLFADSEREVGSARYLELVRRLLFYPVAGLILLVSGFQLVKSFEGNRPARGGPSFQLHLPSWARPVFVQTMRFHTVNSYGLFRVMTTTRPEIILSGSRDGKNWIPYEFKWKPGDPGIRPKFPTPHMPRLDWRMWFAGLVLEGQRAYSPWFVRFVEELLRGNTKVAELMGPSPFPEEPPRFIRIELYHYQFTEGDVRRETGAWWRRELLDNYTNTISLKQKPEGDAG